MSRLEPRASLGISKMGEPAMNAQQRPHMVSTIEALSRKLRAKTGLADQIANTLRNLILAGGIPPGEQIVESRMARQLGVGQPTVREALVALEHQGLVSRKTNHGCIVTTFTREEIADILRIRGELETLAVDLAIENASDEAAEGLAGIARQMVEIAQSEGCEGVSQPGPGVPRNAVEWLGEQASAQSSRASDDAPARFPVHPPSARFRPNRPDFIGERTCRHRQRHRTKR